MENWWKLGPVRYPAPTFNKSLMEPVHLLVQKGYNGQKNNAQNIIMKQKAEADFCLDQIADSLTVMFKWLIDITENS